VIVEMQEQSERICCPIGYSSASTDRTQKVLHNVFILDQSADREGLVVELLRELVQPHRLNVRAIQRVERGIVLVGLPKILTDSALEHVKSLKASAQAVITYADGSDTWDIATKCRPLIAGANALLDSSKVNFDIELLSCLNEALSNSTDSKSARRRLSEEMKRHGIIGESAAIIEAFEVALRYSSVSDLPVLIGGESGTGKELLARAIAEMDPDHGNGPFVAVNCAAVPSTMMESEVFGHRRGAFTGAERERKGWIRTADKGVLFLDEIGEMELGLQAKFLRVLQDSRVRGLGEDHEVVVTTRFIAATNRNLEQSVQQGTFRNDLLHRLQVLTVRMPSLSERRDDIPILVEHFVEKYRMIPPQPIVTITEDYTAALQNAKMNGNIRELENVVRRSLINPGRTGRLCLQDLPVEFLAQLATQEKARSFPDDETKDIRLDGFVKKIIKTQGWNLQRAVQECEKIVCREALRFTNGNQSEAAKILGVTSRCVYNKLRRFEMQHDFQP
jgi:DNA-binding NtrC family response regulator